MEIELLRFKNIKDLKNKLSKMVEKYNWKIGEIAPKIYYDNDFQDYELMFSIYDKCNNLLYDVTVYYCITRTNEKIIVETSYEKQY